MTVSKCAISIFGEQNISIFPFKMTLTFCIYINVIYLKNWNWMEILKFCPNEAFQSNGNFQNFLSQGNYIFSGSFLIGMKTNLETFSRMEIPFSIQLCWSVHPRDSKVDLSHLFRTTDAGPAVYWARLQSKLVHTLGFSDLWWQSVALSRWYSSWRLLGHLEAPTTPLFPQLWP